MNPIGLRFTSIILYFFISAGAGCASLSSTPDFQSFFEESPTRTSLVYRGSYVSVEFFSGRVVYALPGHKHHKITIAFQAYNKAAAQGTGRLSGKVNYFLGTDEARWATNRALFSSIIYRELWPGIDVSYYPIDGNVKSEFRIAPRANPNLVRWDVEGADSVRILPDGAVMINAGGQQLKEDAPTVFQIDSKTGARRAIKGSFRMITRTSLGIRIGGHDANNPVLFDPVIAYSTYLGGSQQTTITGITSDSAGNAILAGYTLSLDIAPGVTFGVATGVSAFVAKLSAAGNQLLFCTYIGGSLDNRALAVTVDRWDNIYLTGSTTSVDFPVLKPLQGAMAGVQDAFITELTPSGNSLVFSSFWGGSGSDEGNGIAVSRQGFISIAGDTQSTDFPVRNPFQPSPGGSQDSYIVTFGISGSKVISSSYLGGSGNEHAASIAIDANGSAIVVGSTDSSDFPVVKPIQSRGGGGQDIFVAKVNGFGTALLFSTYFGGSGGTAGLPETGTAVAVDAAGAIYVAGTTSSSDFPVTQGAFQPSLNGLLDAFAFKLTSRGALIYSTLLGGSALDYGGSIAVDSAGNAHVAGYTGSSDFPLVRGVQGATPGSYNAFAAELNPSGTSLLTSSVIGGSGSDFATALAVDRYGTVLLAGQTLSADLPVLNAYQSSIPGRSSGFVARIVAGWTPKFYTLDGNWGTDTLLNYNGAAAAVVTATFGQPGDIPILGDWTGSGHQNIGVFRNGTWFLDIDGDGSYTTADRSFIFGMAGDVPVVGDWNGSGAIKAGLYRNGTFILDFSGHLSGIVTDAPDQTFPFGLSSDTPVAGDWNGNGVTKVGIFRSGQWFLDSNGSHTINGIVRIFGAAGDIPLVGSWDGAGTAQAGVYRNGTFILDYDGNWLLDLANGDIAVNFGPPSATGLIAY